MIYDIYITSVTCDPAEPCEALLLAAQFEARHGVHGTVVMIQWEDPKGKQGTGRWTYHIIYHNDMYIYVHICTYMYICMI